jgi:hypothetical protein
MAISDASVATIGSVSNGSKICVQVRFQVRTALNLNWSYFPVPHPDLPQKPIVFQDPITIVLSPIKYLSPDHIII